jgi:hypothetical protein
MYIKREISSQSLFPHNVQIALIREMNELRIYLTMPSGGGSRLSGTSSDDHDLTVVGDETVDGCEV